ncbi:TetR/AcrR family transcriptional regulator [Yokenella regensburgei]|uniref:TetR/AcrR family transcriptional regulator n=1 Tax=Yokenella regensburgei TaxID=158877 RepID=UPI003F14A920
MARPKSEDKKLALLDAAAVAIGQTGIAASTAAIARNAGVAEGTLFRYFATKDDLLNALYLYLKSDLCRTMIDGLDRAVTDPKLHTQSIWNSYIDWGIRHPTGHNAIRQISVSEKITPATRQKVHEMFPELHEICHRSIMSEFLSEAFSSFGDAIFLTLAETTMDFASRDPEKSKETKRLGFEAMWRALTAEGHRGQ